jgi:hypothetical protein
MTVMDEGHKKRLLACRLTTDELLERGGRLAGKMDKRERVDDERKEKASEYKEQLEQIDAEIAQLRRAIASGTEEREVPVVERRIDTGNRIEMVRLDTGEVVSERAMTIEERQGELDLAGQPVVADMAVTAGEETEDEDADDDVVEQEGAAGDPAPAEKKKRGAKLPNSTTVVLHVPREQWEALPQAKRSKLTQYPFYWAAGGGEAYIESNPMAWLNAKSLMNMAKRFGLECTVHAVAPKGDVASGAAT